MNFKELLEKQKQERLRFLSTEKNAHHQITTDDFKYMTREERMSYMTLCINTEFCINHDMLDLMTYNEKTYWFKNSAAVYNATHIERTAEHKEYIAIYM